MTQRTFALFADLHGIPRGKLFDTRRGEPALAACRGVLTKDLFGRPVLFDRYARPRGGADVTTHAHGGAAFDHQPQGGRAVPPPFGADRLSIVSLVDDDGGAHPLDARARLQTWLQASLRDSSKERPVTVGTELEFYLSASPPEAGTPSAQTLDGQAYATGGLAAREACLSAILDTLDAFDIGWHALSQENAVDQYEISLAPTDPLTQADHVFLARLICRSIAPRYALCCTFAPLVALDSSPSHLHVHLSSSAFDIGTADAPGSSVQAVLGLANDVLAVLCPSALSRRTADIASFSTTQLDVGEDDRFRAVRLLGRGDNRRMEVRIATAEANPYLALLGLLGAASSGAPTNNAGPARAAGGNALQLSVDGSLDRFARSPLNRQLFGDALVAHLVALKRAEFAHWTGEDVDIEVAALRRVL